MFLEHPSSSNVALSANFLPELKPFIISCRKSCLTLCSVLGILKVGDKDKMKLFTLCKEKSDL